MTFRQVLDNFRKSSEGRRKSSENRLKRRHQYVDIIKEHYTLARSYESCKRHVLVARRISHLFTALTHEILFLPFQHIISPPCNMPSLYSICPGYQYLKFLHLKLVVCRANTIKWKRTFFQAIIDVCAVNYTLNTKYQTF